MFEYSPDIEPKDFEIFSNKIKTRQPSIPAISFQKLVRADERISYENMMRQIYSDKFQITERDGIGRFIRAAEREAYTPITMRSFYDKNSKIMGFDTSTSVRSKSAREKAKATKAVTISQAFKLATSKVGSKSVILYLSLNHNNKFSGYVSLSVYVVKAIQSAIKSINMQGLSLNVWDGRSTNNNIIYSSYVSPAEDELPIIKQGLINFISHDWFLELTPNSSYLNQLLI